MELIQKNFIAGARTPAWRRWGDTNGKSMYVDRPGREPFGLALELATGESLADRIPPGGNGRYVIERDDFGRE